MLQVFAEHGAGFLVELLLDFPLAKPKRGSHPLCSTLLGCRGLHRAELQEGPVLGGPPFESVGRESSRSPDLAAAGGHPRLRTWWAVPAAGHLSVLACGQSPRLRTSGAGPWPQSSPDRTTANAGARLPHGRAARRRSRAGRPPRQRRRLRSPQHGIQVSREAAARGPAAARYASNPAAPSARGLKAAPSPGVAARRARHRQRKDRPRSERAPPGSVEKAGPRGSTPTEPIGSRTVTERSSSRHTTLGTSSSS